MSPQSSAVSVGTCRFGRSFREASSLLPGWGRFRARAIAAMVSGAPAQRNFLGNFLGNFLEQFSEDADWLQRLELL